MRSNNILVQIEMFLEYIIFAIAYIVCIILGMIKKNNIVTESFFRSFNEFTPYKRK